MPVINITRDEFRGFVYNSLPYYFEETTVGNEYAYKTSLGNDYYLRILTSISEDTEVVRDKGEDAIRIHIIDDSNNIIRSAPHTKRIPNYRENIKEKITSLIVCDECGDDLKVGNGPYGDYFFCVNDDCENTESIE